MSQGNISWAFWPSSRDVVDNSNGNGIWLKDIVTPHDVDDVEAIEWEDGYESDDCVKSETPVESDEEESDKDDAEEDELVAETKGRFDALSTVVLDVDL